MRRIAIAAAVVLLVIVFYCSSRTGHQGPPAEDAFVATVNADYARLGRRLLSATIAPNEYLGAVRDRSRKLRDALKDPTWSDAFAKGDADGDLVPDDRDRCPQTPDLERTDDRGCPEKGPLPEAPSAEDVAKAKAALKLSIDPSCNGAPPPDLVAPLQIGLDPGDSSSFLIAVEKPRNQPEKCLVIYEVAIRSERGSFFLQMQRTANLHFLFRASENIDTSPKSDYQHVFRIHQADVPAWNDLVASSIEPSDREERIISVRTVNGNGLSRGWSGPRTFKRNFSNRVFTP